MSSAKPTLCVTEDEMNAKLALNALVFGSIAILALLISIFSLTYAMHKIRSAHQSHLSHKPAPALYILPAGGEQNPQPTAKSSR